MHDSTLRERDARPLGARITDMLRVLGYQRFPLAMVASLFALLQVPQIREFLLIYRLPAVPAFSEAVFVALSALAAWYAGRMTYRIDPRRRADGTASELVLYPGLRRRLPRLYALLVPLAPALASWQVGVLDKAVMYAVMGVALFAFVLARRPLVRRLMPSSLALPADAVDDTIVYRWRDLGRAERFWLAAAAAAALVLWILSAWRPDWAAGALGTTGVLFLSGGVMAILGTVLMQLITRAQWPFTLALAGWLGIVAVMPWGKLHYVDSARPAAPGSPGPAGATLPRPFAEPGAIVVAAEGGGIRAAYWTSLALHTLDVLTDGAFRDRLRIASGVSGGSLGLATFALTRDAGPLQGDCTFPLQPSAESAQSRALVLGHCFLAEDYLGPVALRMLWFDSLRLFAPLPLWTDRGEALEDGWARQWLRLSGSDAFDAALSALDTRDTTWIFNSTHVQTGRRIIQSAPWLPELDRLAPAAIDGRDAVGVDIALKQAVHNSARFTYVSPSGAVDRDGAVLQLVDGGYFENSGLSIINDWLIYRPVQAAAAAADVADATGDPFSQEASKQRTETTASDGLSIPADKFPPLVLLLTNDPSVAPPVPRECRPSEPASQPAGEHELVAPVASLLQARSARGAYARDQTRALVDEQDFFQLAIHEADDSVPLGWALSRASIAEMQRQMWCEQRCGHSNPDRLLALVTRMGADADVARTRLAQLCATKVVP